MVSITSNCGGFSFLDVTVVIFFFRLLLVIAHLTLILQQDNIAVFEYNVVLYKNCAKYSKKTLNNMRLWEKGIKTKIFLYRQNVNNSWYSDLQNGRISPV